MVRSRSILAALALVLIATSGSAAPSDDAERAVTFQTARLTADNPFTRASATDELRRLSAVEANREALRGAVAALKPLLQDPQPVVRWNAAVVVARVGDDAAAQAAHAALERDTRDDLYSVRIGAVEALGELGTPRAHELLTTVAETDDDEEVVDAARTQLGPPPGRGNAFDAFGGAPEGPDQQDRAGGFWMLGAGDEDSESPASALSRARDAAARAPAPDALATLADVSRFRGGFVTDEETVSLPDAFRPAVLPIMRMLRAGSPLSPMDARNAAWALGVSGSLPMLIAALEDPLDATREAAAAALLVAVTDVSGVGRADAGTAEVADALVFSLSDPSEPVRRIAALTLGKVRSERHRRDLHMALDDKSPRVRAAAAWALAQMPPSDEREAALARMRHEEATSPDAIFALLSLGPPDLVELLASALSGGDPAVSYAAAAALAEMGADGIPALRELPDGAPPWARDGAQRAFASIFGNAWAVPVSEASGDAGDGQVTVPVLVMAGGGWRHLSLVRMERPVPGAQVRVSGVASPSVTDELGWARLKMPVDTALTVRVEAKGYVTADVSVDAAAGTQEPIIVRLDER
ncbi:hypothetical protein FJZ36_03020 [Candidatus Poribacteria bacterium]|nr:hypothetical protein [Candidatus Poribacteria bacterium]